MTTTCYDNLFQANIDLAAGVTNIVLCANTVFEVGAPVDANFNSFAGGIPLIVETNGVTIQCGDTGVSTDGCVLSGGFAQLFLGDPSDTTTTANDLTVKGVTFTGTMESIDAAVDGTLAPRAVYGTNSGSNIVFEDCVFTDMVTGYVFDITPSAATSISITGSTFVNIQHTFDVIYADSLTTIALDTVTFTNVDHVEPTNGIDKCATATETLGCDYTSSIIKLEGSSSTLSAVTIADSIYYTALLQTSFQMTTPEPLLTATDTSVFLEANRTINEEYCLGGYAFNHDTSTGFDWNCTRLTSIVDIFELLRCGKDCTTLDEYSTFLSVLELTGLDTELAALGDVTVFVPTNSAFEDAPDGFVEKLIANDTALLKTILEYHITSVDPVSTSAIDIGVPSALTLMGESVSFTPAVPPDNLYKVDGIDIIRADWEEAAGSGKVMHVIDGVLIPDSVEVFPSLGERIEELGLTSVLAAAAYIDWEPEFVVGQDYTIFAPTNDALSDSNAAQTLLSTDGKSESQIALDKADLELLLNHHVVKGNYDLASLQAQDCLILASLAGRNIKITFADSSLLWNDVITNGTQVDIIAHNGYVHTIEGVLSIGDDLSCVGTSAGVATPLSMPLMVLSALGSIYCALFA